MDSELSTKTITLIMSKKRRRYDREFKLRVVQRSYEVSSIKELGVELGIRPELIYRWRTELARKPEKGFPGKGNKELSAEEKENEQLRKELADVKMEHEILKKAIGIFSRKDGKRFNS